MTKPYARRFVDPKHLYRRWIDPRVYALRIPEVVAYLHSRGWTEVAPDRKGYLVFQEPPSPEVPGGPYYQFVPDSEAIDLPLRMFELVTGLAEVEDRQASAVIDDILGVARHDEPNGVARPATQEAGQTCK
jgi:hypothetical protein